MDYPRRLYPRHVSMSVRPREKDVVPCRIRHKKFGITAVQSRRNKDCSEKPETTPHDTISHISGDEHPKVYSPHRGSVADKGHVRPTPKSYKKNSLLTSDEGHRGYQ